MDQSQFTISVCRANSIDRIVGDGKPVPCNGNPIRRADHSDQSSMPKGCCFTDAVGNALSAGTARKTEIAESIDTLTGANQDFFNIMPIYSLKPCRFFTDPLIDFFPSNRYNDEWKRFIFHALSIQGRVKQTTPFEKKGNLP